MYNVKTMQQAKDAGQKIVMLTVYDFLSAQMAQAGGINYLLVGDSLGMVCLGYESTVSVTMADMLHHLKAVKRGTKDGFIVADMPFMSYYSSKTALSNAALLMSEGGAQAVKLEGGSIFAPTVRDLVNNGVPVMGHLGLTPQSVNVLGGYKTQATDTKSALRLMQDAITLQEAGAFALVLEMIPAELAELVSKKLRIPTIGIGAGPHCDGQVQVFGDLAGLFTAFQPLHTHRYASAFTDIKTGIEKYVSEVQNHLFPALSNYQTLNPQVLVEINDASF